MFSVIVSEKGGAERREVFDRTEINVGRVQGNDLMLPKGNVSKRHARLLFRDGRFIITDLKSTNGTYVNGRKIAQATIVREGDKIYIGDFICEAPLPAERFAFKGRVHDIGEEGPPGAHNGAGQAACRCRRRGVSLAQEFHQHQPRVPGAVPVFALNVVPALFRQPAEVLLELPLGDRLRVRVGARGYELLAAGQNGNFELASRFPLEQRWEVALIRTLLVFARDDQAAVEILPRPAKRPPAGDGSPPEIARTGGPDPERYRVQGRQGRHDALRAPLQQAGEDHEHQHERLRQHRRVTSGARAAQPTPAAPVVLGAVLVAGPGDRRDARALVEAIRRGLKLCYLAHVGSSWLMWIGTGPASGRSRASGAFSWAGCFRLCATMSRSSPANASWASAAPVERAAAWRTVGEAVLPLRSLAASARSSPARVSCATARTSSAFPSAREIRGGSEASTSTR